MFILVRKLCEIFEDPGLLQVIESDSYSGTAVTDGWLEEICSNIFASRRSRHLFGAVYCWWRTCILLFGTTQWDCCETWKLERYFCSKKTYAWRIMGYAEQRIGFRWYRQYFSKWRMTSSNDASQTKVGNVEASDSREWAGGTKISSKPARYYISCLHRFHCFGNAIDHWQLLIFTWPRYAIYAYSRAAISKIITHLQSTVIKIKFFNSHNFSPRKILQVTFTTIKCAWCFPAPPILHMKSKIWSKWNCISKNFFIIPVRFKINEMCEVKLLVYL